MKSLPLSTSWKHHFLVALLTGGWLFAFLVLIAPFDVADLDFNARLIVMPVYGLVVCVCYLILVAVQNLAFQKLKRWHYGFEALFLIAFGLLSFAGALAYYRTPLVRGDYELGRFTFEVFTPIYLVLLPVLIFSRWFINRKTPVLITKVPTVVRTKLTGDSKRDVLQIDQVDLIAVSSADNYVEVFYRDGTELRKKVLRNTLKSIQEEEPNLIKVHRSHLINPHHLISWKDNSTLQLTQMEVPVSKSFKQQVLELDHSSQIASRSPQTQ